MVVPQKGQQNAHGLLYKRGDLGGLFKWGEFGDFQEKTSTKMSDDKKGPDFLFYMLFSLFLIFDHG